MFNVFIKYKGLESKQLGDVQNCNPKSQYKNLNVKKNSANEIKTAIIIVFH